MRSFNIEPDLGDPDPFVKSSRKEIRGSHPSPQGRTLHMARSLIPHRDAYVNPQGPGTVVPTGLILVGDG